MATLRSNTMVSLILVGYGLILLAVMGLGWLAISSMERLRGITKDFYEHPFAASNAASDLKATLFQLRNHVVQAAIVRDGAGNYKTGLDEALDLGKRIRADLAAIKVSFVGDKSKVEQLELKLGEWDIIRAEILAAVARGDYPAAENFVRNIGSPKFAEIEPLVDELLSNTRERGKRLADEAEAHSLSISADIRIGVALLLGFVLLTGFSVVRRVRFLHAELARLATVDSLTDVPNRAYFLELAGRELARSQRYGQPFALAITDLDLFKAINDSHGHQVGDLVLKKFSDIARRALRDADIIGRIGGEEFAILLPNAPTHEAREILERVRGAIEDAVIPLGAAPPMRFTASFGVTVYAGDKDTSSLLKRADEALYEAKHRGRNRICIRQAGNADNIDGGTP